MGLLSSNLETVSLFDFLQNKLSEGPAIIGTIDTLAKYFIKVQKENPQFGKQEIYLEVLRQRYNFFPLNSKTKQQLEKQVNDKLGFKGFIMKVLYAETELANTDPKFIWEVPKTIEKELKQYPNLPI